MRRRMAAVFFSFLHSFSVLVGYLMVISHYDSLSPFRIANEIYTFTDLDVIIYLCNKMQNVAGASWVSLQWKYSRCITLSNI